MAVSEDGEGKGRKRVSKEERRAERANNRAERNQYTYVEQPQKLDGAYSERQVRLSIPNVCANCYSRSSEISMYWTGQVDIQACSDCIAKWESGTVKLPEPKRDRWVSIVSHANGGGRKS